MSRSRSARPVYETGPSHPPIRDARRAAHHPVPVLRNRLQVGAGNRCPGPAEPGHPLLDVGGIAGAALLAVIDDVDSGLRLRAHDVGNRRPHLRLKAGVSLVRRMLPAMIMSNNFLGRGRLPV